MIISKVPTGLFLCSHTNYFEFTKCFLVTELAYSLQFLPLTNRRGPGLESGISHNDPDAMQDHCVKVKVKILRVERQKIDRAIHCAKHKRILHMKTKPFTIGGCRCNGKCPIFELNIQYVNKNWTFTVASALYSNHQVHRQPTKSPQSTHPIQILPNSLTASTLPLNV